MPGLLAVLFSRVLLPTLVTSVKMNWMREEFYDELTQELEEK